MLRYLFIIVVLLFAVGCSLYDDDVFPVSLELTASNTTYSDGDKVTFTAKVSGGSGGHILSWKLDDENFHEGSETEEFGPFSDDSFHKVTCKVEGGGSSAEETITIKSKKFLTYSPVYQNGRLKVSSGKLVNERNEIVQLRGMSTHGLQYFPETYTENSIKALAELWDADIIRLSCYVNEGWKEHGTYLDEPSYWRSFVDTLVGYAEKYGIYAMIDWHMLSPGDPNYYIDEAKEFWSYMVKKHGDKEHVIFDICNEPNNEGSWGGTIPGKNVTWGEIKKYADEIIEIIRAKSDNLVIVGTPEWASRPDLVIGNELSYDNVMYTMHFYAASHKQSYRDNVSKAIKAGIPVFVTEFGTQYSSGGGDNDFNESEKWLELLEKNDISWCNWNYSPDDSTGAVFKYRPSTLSDYADSSNLKEAGQWIFDKIKNR